ncbi:uncharacterized [Tachysurus ichikawai]
MDPDTKPSSLEGSKDVCELTEHRMREKSRSETERRAGLRQRGEQSSETEEEELRSELEDTASGSCCLDVPVQARLQGDAHGVKHMASVKHVHVENICKTTSRERERCLLCISSCFFWSSSRSLASTCSYFHLFFVVHHTSVVTYSTATADCQKMTHLTVPAGLRSSFNSPA